MGEILTRVYILQDNYNVPMYGELNLSGNNGPNFVIRDPKKVVVEQNEKVKETADTDGQSIVGIFKKIADKNKSGSYSLDQETAQGLILTSDGWLITGFVPENVKIQKDQQPNFDAKTVSEILKNYVVITKNGNIFEPDNLVYDKMTGYSFWHVNARDLLVINFSNASDIQNGQTALALNWDGWMQVTQIVGQKNESSTIRSSDSCLNRLVLEKNLNEKFNGTFLFNLNNDAMAVISANGDIIPIYNFSGVIKGILRNKKIVRPVLGINYLNLSDQLSADGKTRKGVLISKNGDKPGVIKGSPAEKIGLKEGDIITTVNNIQLDNNNDLCAILAGFVPGDEIAIEYERNGELKQAKIKLGI